MTEKVQPEASKSTNVTESLGATEVLLILSGIVLVLVAMASTQWLEARSGYDHDADWPVGAGLFTSAASSGAQFVAMVCLGTTALLAFLGLVWRILLPLSLGFAMAAAAASSWWVLDARTWQVGRTYPFALFALVVLMIGLARAGSGPRASGAKSTGNFVGGQKDGRWYVYDDSGQCVGMEDWDHGTLLSAKPLRRA
jgi:hypothetical protein